MGRRQFEAVQKKRRDERTGIGNDWVVQGIEKAIQTVFEETIQKRSGRVGRETAKRGGGKDKGDDVRETAKRRVGKDKGDDVGNGSLVVGRWGEEPHSRTQPAPL